MNVNDAMETAAAYFAANKHEKELLFFSETVAITLAAEVERLRGEVEWLREELQLRDNYDKRVPDPRDHKFFDRTCGEHGCKSRQIDRLKAELAAAKAASACPVKVLNIWEGTYQSDRYIELRTDAEADTFSDWLRERMKERGEQ